MRGWVCLSPVSRRTLGRVTFGLLAALFALVLAFPIRGGLGVAVFAIVVVLVGVVFFRFHPAGDIWDISEEVGVNPWLAVVLLLVLAAIVFALRYELLHSAGT